MSKKNSKKQRKAKKRAAKRSGTTPQTASLPQQAMPAQNRLRTLTQEPFQLTRLYYHLIDHQEIPPIFSQLGCMDYDDQRDQWLWLYQAETKKIKFQTMYRDIPKEQRPVVLGAFYSPSYKQMYLDLTSLERARQAILFFHKYFPAHVAEVTHIEVLNKWFTQNGTELPAHNDYFDQPWPPQTRAEQFRHTNISDLVAPFSGLDAKVETLLAHIEILEKQTAV